MGRDRRKFVDFDFDELGGILCDALLRSNNDGDWLTDIPDFFVRDHGLAIRLSFGLPVLSNWNDGDLADFGRGILESGIIVLRNRNDGGRWGLPINKLSDC